MGLKRLSRALLAVVVVAFFGACQFPLGPRSVSIRVGFPGHQPSRTLAPDASLLEVDHWSLSGTGPSERTFQYDNIVPGENFLVNAIEPGHWDLSAKAFDSLGSVLMTAEGSVEAVIGEDAHAQLFLRYAEGEGAVQLGISFPALSQLVGTVVVDPDTDRSVTVALANGVAQTISLTAGFHSLQFKVGDGAKTWWSSREAVLVLDGKTSTAQTDLGVSGFADRLLLISAHASAGTPFDLHLRSTTGAGLVTLTADYAGTNSLEVEGPVTYQWFRDGEPLGIGESEHSESWSSVPTTYSVLAYGSRAIASATVQVMPGGTPPVVPVAAPPAFELFPTDSLVDNTDKAPTEGGYNTATGTGRFVRITKNLDPGVPGYVIAGSSGPNWAGFTTLVDFDGLPVPGYNNGTHLRTLASLHISGNAYFGNTMGIVQQPTAPYGITTNEYIQNGVGNASYLQYGTGGVTLVASSFVTGPYRTPSGTMAPAAGGQLYVSEWWEYSAPKWQLFRLNADLTIDGSFVSSNYPAVGRPSFLVTDASNQLVTAGDGGDVVRFTTSGALDTSFGTGGVANITIGGNGLTTAGLKIDPITGKLYVTGTAGTEVYLVRLNSDGSLDSSFSGGYVDVGYQDVRGLDIDYLGRIVVVGDSLPGEVAGSAAYVRRFSGTGVLDGSLDVTCTEGGAYGSGARDVIADGANVIVVGFVKLDTTAGSGVTQPAFWRF